MTTSLSSTEHALLARVVAEPENIGLRLILADALEQYEGWSQDRIDLIRSMIELSRDSSEMHLTPAERDAHDAIIQTWLNERRWGKELESFFGWNWSRMNCCEWIQWHHRRSIQAVWSCGWIRSIRCSWADWHSKIEPVVAWCPPLCTVCRGEKEVLYVQGVTPVPFPGIPTASIMEPHISEASPCTACRDHNGTPTGRGVLMETCPECGLMETGPEWAASICHVCSDAGRVPRVMPDVAQPLTDVELTTWPEFQVGSLRLRLDETEGPAADAFRRYTDETWHGIRFHLPGETR